MKYRGRTTCTWKGQNPTKYTPCTSQVDQPEGKENGWNLKVKTTCGREVVGAESGKVRASTTGARPVPQVHKEGKEKGLMPASTPLTSRPKTHIKRQMGQNVKPCLYHKAPKVWTHRVLWSQQKVLKAGCIGYHQRGKCISTNYVIAAHRNCSC